MYMYRVGRSYMGSDLGYYLTRGRIEIYIGMKKRGMINLRRVMFEQRGGQDVPCYHHAASSKLNERAVRGRKGF